MVEKIHPPHYCKPGTVASAPSKPDTAIPVQQGEAVAWFRPQAAAALGA